MQNYMETLMPRLEPLLTVFAEDLFLRIGQVLLILFGFILVYLVFFTTRDIILRTHSFLYMLFCIFLVALLPIVGFLFYLLIRPARTFKQRETDNMLRALLEGLARKKMKDQASKKREAKGEA